jgi:hypothetical protein
MLVSIDSKMIVPTMVTEFESNLEKKNQVKLTISSEVNGLKAGKY